MLFTTYLSGIIEFMFCLVDGNNFYVSCERVFKPYLIGKPVIVLSNNDGCVVSRSQEAKDLGIKMGQPYHQCRRCVELNNVQVMSSNYALYADISERMMRLLQTLTPDCEVYSIDESFLYFHHTQYSSWHEQGRAIKAMIQQHLGIPVGVGFGKTKTLAKLANKLAKQAHEGVCCIHDYDLNKLLKNIALEAIWGVASGISKRLKRQGIYNAYHLREAPLRIVRSSCHSYGETLKFELMGISVIPLTCEKSPNKQIISSRSFGVGLSDKASLFGALTENIIRATEKLRAGRLKTKQWYVFLQSSRFKPGYCHHGVDIMHTHYTSVTAEIVSHSLNSMQRYVTSDHVYTKSGIILTDLQLVSQIQPTLFEPSYDRMDALMKACDDINHKWGRGTITLSQVHQPKQHWKMKQNQRSQAYSTQWNDILTVQ